MAGIGATQAPERPPGIRFRLGSFGGGLRSDEWIPNGSDPDLAFSRRACHRRLIGQRKEVMQRLEFTSTGFSPVADLQTAFVIRRRKFLRPEYTRQDLNLQPLAPEANALSN